MWLLVQWTNLITDMGGTRYTFNQQQLNTTMLTNWSYQLSNNVNN